MKNKKKIGPQILNMEKRIRVKLDYKTTLIINRLSSFAVWKKLYPNAEIMR